jgi:hypothetical protein
MNKIIAGSYARITLRVRVRDERGSRPIYILLKLDNEILLLEWEVNISDAFYRK